ncbi:MAG: putative Ig domain-containing protein [Bacteroidales bacterium]|nr:putative Ig domain-containing protein [Bacteroidales bacterium]
MARRKSEEQNVFSLSFVDVFANTLGGLAFILMLVILMIGMRFGIPRINTDKLPDAYDGSPYEIWLSANDGGGLYNWKIVKGELPSGLEIINTNSGHIKGVPTLKDKSKVQEIYKFTIKVDVGDTALDKTDLREYEIVLNSSPYGNLKIMTGKKIPKAVIGSEYPLVFSVQGGKLPYTWKIDCPGLAGIKIDENGKLNGKINGEPGKQKISVTVRDQYGNNASKEVEIEIIKMPEIPPPPPKLIIKTDSLPKAINGRGYRIALSAEGGVAPYKWSGLINGTNLKIDDKGYITGIPDATGEYTANFEVTDNKNNTVSKSGIEFTVLPSPRDKIEPLEILTENPLPEAISGKNYQLFLSASGGTPPYFWNLNKNPEIAGSLTLSENGKLSADFEHIGEFEISAMVHDALKIRVEKTFRIKVIPSVPEMKIMTNKLPDAVKGFLFEGDLSAEGGYPPYEWNIDGGLPDGLILEGNKIKGIPKNAWQGELAVTIKDITGVTARKSLGFEILESGEGSIVHKLEILTDTMPTLLTGSNYDFYIATDGGGTPKNWQVDGKIPKGLSFENGRFYGRPQNKGTYKFSVKVSDPAGQTKGKEYSLIVRSVVNAYWRPMAIILAIALAFLLLILIIMFIRIRRSRKFKLSVVTQSIPNARCSFPYRVYLAAEGGTPPYKWALSEGKLPDGLELKPEGIIQGEPLKGVKLDDVKEYSFKITVTDSLGNSATQQL